MYDVEVLLVVGCWLLVVGCWLAGCGKEVVTDSQTQKGDGSLPEEVVEQRELAICDTTQITFTQGVVPQCFVDVCDSVCPQPPFELKTLKLGLEVIKLEWDIPSDMVVNEYLIRIKKKDQGWWDVLFGLMKIRPSEHGYSVFHLGSSLDSYGYYNVARVCKTSATTKTLCVDLARFGRFYELYYSREGYKWSFRWGEGSELDVGLNAWGTYQGKNWRSVFVKFPYPVELY